MFFDEHHQKAYQKKQTGCPNGLFVVSLGKDSAKSCSECEQHDDAEVLRCGKSAALSFVLW